MKLFDLVSVMNIYDVTLYSENINELLPGRQLNMLDLDHDHWFQKYADHEVVRISNPCKKGDMICIK